MRPAIPYDPTPDAEGPNRKRSIRRLAEAGHRRGAPVKPIPHYGLADEKDRPPMKPEPPEDVA